MGKERIQEKAPELMSVDEWDAKERKHYYEEALTKFLQDEDITVEGLLKQGETERDCDVCLVYNSTKDRKPIGRIPVCFQRGPGDPCASTTKTFVIGPWEISTNRWSKKTTSSLCYGIQHGKLKLSNQKKLLMSDVVEAVAWANDCFKPEPDRDYYNDEESMDIHIDAIIEAVKLFKPVNASAVDSYEYYIKLPEGYVKQGENYVYQGKDQS